MSLGLIGSRLGKYEILSEIGQGGMSVVYRARDTQLERDVAIKVMHAFLADQPEARERFHREAVAVARLRHPHIIEIYDYSGETASMSYIVTEIVEGSSLSDMLKRQPLFPPESALLLARPVAAALEHAHAHGIIHRDLKPENILVGKDGGIKLTDFGIARMLDNQTLTVTGTLLGSPAYMAPEYIDGDITDAKSDIFSFGAMLYQFAVGKLPFEAHSPHGLLKKIVAGEYIPAEQQNPSVHAALGRIIKRSLMREPSARYASAKDLLAAIDAQIERLGLDADGDRKKLLADAEAFGRGLEAELPAKYLALGKIALAARQVGTATADFDRVLSLQPDHQEVRKILKRLTRRAWTGRAARDAVLSIAGAAIVTLVAGSWMGTPSVPEVTEPVTVTQTERPPPVDQGRNVVFVIEGKGDLFVDEALVKRGVSTSFAWLLPPGEHSVKLVGQKRTSPKTFTVPKDGSMDPVTLDVRVDSPTVTQPAQKKQKPVQLRIAGGGFANVYVDGNLVAVDDQTPVDLVLPYGEHQVRLASRFAQSHLFTVVVSDTEPSTLEPIVMEPLPARLLIDDAPAGSLVEVAGKRVRLLPGEPVLVPIADIKNTEYEVVVTKDTQELLRVRHKFQPGQDAKLAVSRKPL